MENKPFKKYDLFRFLCLIRGRGSHPSTVNGIKNNRKNNKLFPHSHYMDVQTNYTGHLKIDTILNRLSKMSFRVTHVPLPGVHTPLRRVGSPALGIWEVLCLAGSQSHLGSPSQNWVVPASVPPTPAAQCQVVCSHPLGFTQ